jgi:nucleotide-binding universal stress UspA family protein
MKLLLTLDGSRFSECAIPLAQQLGQGPGTEVHLLAVALPEGAAWAPVFAAGENGAGLAESVLWAYDDPTGYLLHMEFFLEHYVETVARRFPKYTVCLAVRVGPYPAAQIAAYAESNQIDLIVMATHARSPIGQIVHGSVAAEVLRSGVAPVALVKPVGDAAA